MKSFKVWLQDENNNVIVRSVLVIGLLVVLALVVYLIQ